VNDFYCVWATLVVAQYYCMIGQRVSLGNHKGCPYVCIIGQPQGLPLRVYQLGNHKGCIIGQRVSLGNVYHWATCIIGQRVSLGNVYHWATCIIGQPQGLPLRLPRLQQSQFLQNKPQVSCLM
jgi:hypothetical protein